MLFRKNLQSKNVSSDWTVPFKCLNLLDGKLITILDDDEDMLEIKWKDGMWIDVGYIENKKTYYITTVSNDTLDAWNHPLSVIEIQNREELLTALQQEIIRCRS